MKVGVTGFGGVLPGVAAHLLPENGAQVCSNAVRDNGNLRPLKGPLQVVQLPDLGDVVKSLHRYGTGWLQWTTDVDVVPSPLPADTHGRIIYTGDGKPKFTDDTLIEETTPYFYLGVPSPSSAPSANVDVDASLAIWSENTTFEVGDVIYPGNDRAYKVSVGGKSGLTMPTEWPLALGATVTDNEITWVCDMILSTGAKAWAANTVITAGHLIEVGDLLLVATELKKGLSGATEPVFVLVTQFPDLGNTYLSVIDNQIRWTFVGELASGPAWAADTTYYTGDYIVASGRKYVATPIVQTYAGRGKSAADEPSVWPTTLAATVADGEILWTNAGAETVGPSWAANTFYDFDTFIVAGGYKFIAKPIVDDFVGTTADTVFTINNIANGDTPNGAPLTGQYYSDGTVLWLAHRIVSSGARHYGDSLRRAYVPLGARMETFTTDMEYAAVYTCTQAGITNTLAKFPGHIDDAADNYTDGTVKWTRLYGGVDSDGYVNRVTTLANGTWAAETAVAVHSLIRASGKIFRCTDPGTTGGAEPVWNAAVGQVTNDGTAKWTCMWSDRYDTTRRESSTRYAKGAILTINGFSYLATTSGFTGTQVPTFTTTVGLTTEDGDIIWKCLKFASIADQEDVSYVETYVRKWNDIEEESAPSKASDLVTVNFATEQVVQVASTSADPDPLYGVTHRRFYRLAQGSSGTEFLFHSEYALAEATGMADSTPTDKLGAPIRTTLWDMPSDGLSGIVSMPGGLLAGFSGKKVYFCEPYQAHAWPVPYMVATEYDVVGLGVFGNSLLVATTGTPYVITGSQPGYMTVDRLEVNEACLAKRGVVDLGQAVAYPSPNGLVVIGRGIAKVVTAPTHRLEDWTALEPATFIGFCHRGRYFAFHGASQSLLSFDTEGQRADYAVTADAVWTDQLAGTAYLIQGRNVKQFDAGTTLTLSWTSKPWVQSYPLTLGCAVVRAKAYPVTFKIYADGSASPYHTQTVANGNFFRLPAKRMQSFEINLSGTSEIEAVLLATTPAEIGTP